MSDLAIRVENLSKQYKIGVAKYRHDSLRDHLTDWAKSLFVRNGRSSSVSGQLSVERGPSSVVIGPSSPVNGPRSSVDGPAEDTFWALKDVSFEVKRGEVIGIIGRNGAGKSTLLKILSRIVDPTGGFAEIHGRVGSLLEVGTGFHRDLTGRENIYLNGAILGMKKAEIDRKFDEIVAFSEIEKFIDTPVKRYSSGMYVRLAFAVAAHLDPEILIIDEVLAVGDAAFQNKCLRKMESVAQESRTVLFVSHNMQAVNNLCGQAILIDGGRVVKDGDAGSIIKGYVASMTENSTEQLEQVWNDIDTAPGNDKIRLRRISIQPEAEGPNRLIDITTPFTIDIEYWVLVPLSRLLVSCDFTTSQNLKLFGTGNDSDANWQQRLISPGLYRSTCYVPGHLLNDGSYKVGICFYGPGGPLYRNSQAVLLTIHDLESRAVPFYGKAAGVIRPKLNWETVSLTD